MSIIKLSCPLPIDIPIYFNEKQLD
jgi:hypothetical protein